MYLNYFGLRETPFAITPDPAFVYLSAAHRDALAHLMYGVGQGGAGGFVQLTGEVGTGKTTLCRCLLEQVPDDCRVALVLNPLLTPRELVATICEELGLETQGIAHSSKALVDRLNDCLLDQHAQGRRVVVVIDEAQNLSPEALEQVRLLTNLETSKDKLLQMVLLGQPELRQLLQRENLRQLAQRITARYHLAPLGPDETEAYVRHRMRVAGAERSPFRKSALRALYQRSGGVPRLINIIADRSLAAAYASESPAINARMVHAAAHEVQPSETRVRARRWPAVVAATAVVALLAAGVLYLGPRLSLSGPGNDAPRVENSAALPEPASSGAQIAATGSVEEPAAGMQAADTDAAQAAVGAVGESAGSTPSLQSELNPDWLDRQHRGAWQTLADLWQDGQAADAIQSACERHFGSGFACIRDHGNWSRIRQLGLPVILVLQGERPLLLPLIGFADGGVLLGGGADAVAVRRDVVEERWLGEYLVAWPQAPDWPAEIRRGETGPAVDIVMEMASFAQPPWNGDGVFDAGFESWLIAFQRRHGLDADGIVGPNTLIHLMAPTIGEPRLVLDSEESS